MMLSRKMLALLLAGSFVTPSALAQVATPPKPKPEPTRPYTPPDPQRPRLSERPRPEEVRDTRYEPITVRDNEGNIVPLDEPVEYVAMSHNPLLDLETMTKIAPLFYPRRQHIEKLVIDNLDVMLEIENGLIESMRMADEEGMRSTSGKIATFTSDQDVLPYFYSEITNSNLVTRHLGILTQRIMGDHQETLTKEAMTLPPTEDGATGLDQMMQKILRMSVSEHEYFFRRLMMDAADMFAVIRPELGLDAQTDAAIDPLADRLESEGDLDARASLIREIFAQLDPATRKRVLEMTVKLRPEVDTAAQMTPIPEGATPKKLDIQTRMEIILQLLDGGKVDTNMFIEQN